MSQPYNVFNSAEFADREAEFKRVSAILKEKNRGVLIFEGARGSGKSAFLLELYRRLHKQSEIRSFLIGLLPYSADEFKENETIWLNSERAFQQQDIPEVLNRLARSLEIDVIKSDRDFQKDYFARGLAYRKSKNVPVLLVDSVYECPEEVRIEIEKYIFAPLLASERVFLILSGRGKRPIWSSPELQRAEFFTLEPLEKDDVKEQLAKLQKAKKSKRDESEYDKIADLSGGYPLIARVMAETEPEKSLTDALDEAIDIIIKDTLPKPEQGEKKYSETRLQIEKLSLVDIPFRIPDVEAYLYPSDPEERRAKTNKLVALLLVSGLLRYEGKGYQLNTSVTHPIRKWLARKGQYTEYFNQLTEVSIRLQDAYPSAKTWYQRMLPKEGSPSDHTFLSSNLGKTEYAA